MNTPKTKKPTFKKLILDDLKSQGHHAIAQKIKSITYESYSGGCSVRIKAINLWKAERAVLESLADDYKYGTFDPYTDCAGTKPNTANKERRAKHVFVDNEFTPEVKEDVKELLRIEWDIVDDKTAQEKRGAWYDTLVYRECLTLNGGLECISA